MEITEKHYNQLLDRMDELVLTNQRIRRKIRHQRNWLLLFFLLFIAYLAWDQWYPKIIPAHAIVIYDQLGYQRAVFGIAPDDNEVRLSLADKEGTSRLRLLTRLNGESEICLGKEGVPSQGRQGGSYACLQLRASSSGSSNLAFLDEKKNERFLLGTLLADDGTGMFHEYFGLQFLDESGNLMSQWNMNKDGDIQFEPSGKP